MATTTTNARTTNNSRFGRTPAAPADSDNSSTLTEQEELRDDPPPAGDRDEPPPDPPNPGGGDGGDPPEDPPDPPNPDDPQDDPDRPPYIPLDRWIEFKGLGIALGNTFRQNPAPSQRAAKPRDPERFDGTDASKLDEFFFQCKLVFEYSPEAYESDRAKVLYAIQQLKGTAQRHFRKSFNLPAEDQPRYFGRWDLFVEELKDNFGEVDPVGAAVSELLALKMQEHHKVARYKVEFEELADRTKWDNRALHSHFYNGLAERIKDQLAIMGKPISLTGLKTSALLIDNRYWERKAEVSRATKSSKSSQNASKDPTSNSNASTSRSGNTSNSNQSKSRQNDTSSSSSSRQNQSRPAHSNQSGSQRTSNNSNHGRQNQNNRGSTSTSTSNNTSHDKLEGKIQDGKLTDAERQRRTTLGLCLYCGKKGHLLKDCPLRQTKEESQARRAASKPTGKPSAGAGEPAEPKN